MIRFTALTSCLLVLFTLTSCLETATAPQSNHAWQVMVSGTNGTLRGVWGFETGDAFAVGDNGTILHFDGESWKKMQSNTTADLVGVWGADPENVIVTGDRGTILYYDGESWSPMPSKSAAPIGAVFGIGSAYAPPNHLPFWAWAVGGGPPGTVLFFDGLQWQTIDTGGSEELIDITAWVPPPRATNGYPRLMAVGANGDARFSDGDTWSETETGTGEDLVAVFGEAPDNVYAVGRDGTIIQNTKRFTDTGPAASWREVASVAGSGLLDIAARNYNDLFLVGASGQIVNFDRAEFLDMFSPTSATLHAVWSGTTNVYAVGDEGTILSYSTAPQHSECPINITVTVTPGITPVISWSPHCPVSKVVVEDDFGAVQWFVETDGNLIYPGVEYRSVPPGAVERRPTSFPLTEGGLYRIVLVRRDWHGELIVGSWNLIPEMSPSAGSGPIVLIPTGGLDPPSIPPDEARLFYFQRVEPTGTGPDTYTFDSFDGLTKGLDGDWRMIGDPAERESVLDIRHVIVEFLERDPVTGQTFLTVLRDVRIAEVYFSRDAGTVPVVWDVLRED